MPDQITCRMVTDEKKGSICGRPKIMAPNGIGLCIRCDVKGELPWPSAYYFKERA